MELRTVIVGNTYRPIESQERYARLEKDEELTLVREPTNAFDNNAIAVHTADGVHIGYVPRTMNAELAEALDEGRQFLATYDPDIDRLFVTEVAEEDAALDSA